MEDFDATLEQWWYDRKHGVIWGQIVGDKKGRWRDYTFINTSSIKPTGPLVEGAIVTTRNSKYLLGVKQDRED